MNRTRKRSSAAYLTQMALLVAVEVVMKTIGLGSVPVGPLYMSFLTVPIAVGAIILGPMAGAVLGGVFGFVSFMDAVKGASVMTSNLLAVSPGHTFVLCFVTRVLMGACVGWIYQGVMRICRRDTIGCFAASLSAPLLNTLFFMGYIVLTFYQTEYIQGLAAVNGAGSPVTFVVLLVGFQGIVEAIVCSVTGTAVAGGLQRALRRMAH